jgi:hypothetical protein
MGVAVVGQHRGREGVSLFLSPRLPQLQQLFFCCCCCCCLLLLLAGGSGAAHAAAAEGKHASDFVDTPGAARPQVLAVCDWSEPGVQHVMLGSTASVSPPPGAATQLNISSAWRTVMKYV